MNSLPFLFSSSRSLLTDLDVSMDFELWQFQLVKDGKVESLPEEEWNLSYALVTPSPPSPSPSPSPGNTTAPSVPANMPAETRNLIIGLSVGGAVLLMLVIGGIIFYCKTKKKDYDPLD